VIFAGGDVVFVVSVIHRIVTVADDSIERPYIV